MDNIIEVNNLSKSFGQVKAVKDISFNVKRGSLFAFLGLNGAGKSTTINILCSILKKDSGKVIIDGLDLDKNSQKIKSSIGIVFQGSVLDAPLTIYQNLKSRASLYGMNKKNTENRIAYLSEILDLKEILHRPYAPLSGGQKRKADIARALINQPKILFFDEPTTGLDPSTRLTVWAIIEKLMKENNMTLFLTTHYMEESKKADHVLILDSGTIAESGTPDELKTKYATDFVRIITEKSDKNDNLFLKENKKFSYKNNAYFIEIDSPKEGLTLLNKHNSFNDFEIIKGDMDDVFLTVTGKKLEA